MKLTYLLVILVILSPTFAHRLSRLQHSWWCAKAQDSAPFMLTGDDGKHIFAPNKPAIGSYVWLQTGTTQPTKFVSTWVNGQKQIKMIDDNGYKAYIKPAASVATWQWGTVSGQNYNTAYQAEVYLIECPGDKSKV